MMSPNRIALGAAVAVLLTVGILLAHCSSTSATNLLSPSGTTSQQPPPQQNLVLGAFNARSVTYGGKTYLYQVFIPKTYSFAKKGSILMVFHGSGTRGDDNQRQLGEGLARGVKAEAATFPSIAIFPQAPQRTREGDFVPIAFAILDQELKALNGDPTRVYLAGFSYGGYLVYDMAYAAPTRIAALVTIGALMDPLLIPGYPGITKPAAYAAFAQRIRGVPIWSFQGELDPFILASEARLVAGIQKAEGDVVTYTEFQGAGHDVTAKMWTPALFTWLWAQHR